MRTAGPLKGSGGRQRSGASGGGIGHLSRTLQKVSRALHSAAMRTLTQPIRYRITGHAGDPRSVIDLETGETLASGLDAPAAFRLVGELQGRVVPEARR